ncbi:unnamed protein product [Urochloa humidicola]
MAGDETLLSLVRAIDLSAAVDDPVQKELARRRRRAAAANGDRDDEDVARGWSSAVVDRSLSLRRRGGSGAGAGAAAPCSRRRDGLIRMEERSEGAAAPGALGIGIGAEAAVAKAPGVDMVSFFCLAVL